MSVRIRFRREGRPHDPYFRLVAIDRRQARDGHPVEILGTLNPRNKKKVEKLNLDRLRYWISVGATPTYSVLHALKASGIWDQVKSGAVASSASSVKP
jgi:small subunit ribosomal protein S16